MRKLLLTIALLLGFTLPAQGQGNTVLLLFPGVPSGSCAFIMLAIDNSTGILYDCDGGAWNEVGPGVAGATSWSSLTDPTASIDLLGNAVAEIMTWDFQADYTNELLFDLKTTTGTPSGGVLLNAQVHDADVTIFRAWDGTDGVQVSGIGVLSALNSGGVAWAALLSYPTGCTNQFVRTIGDSLTCETVVAADKDLTENQTWTGMVTFVPSGLGGLADFDIQIGDTDGTPTYGIARLGNSFGGRTSFISGSLDLDGAVLWVNQGGPVTSDIEFAWMESSSVVRFAIAGSGAGLGTYSPRSLIVAGPAPANSNMVTCDTWTTDNDNIDCDTGGTGADLFVQDDAEIEGTVFAGVLTEGGNAVPNDTDTLDFFAETTSAEFLGMISNETGTTGLVVASINPTLTDVTIDDVIEFTETAGDGTCAGGNFNIKANSSTNKLRGCENGASFDLNTAGGGNSFGTIGNAVADSGADTLTVTDSSRIDFTTTNDPEDLTADIVADSVDATYIDETDAYAFSSTGNTFVGASYTSPDADPADAGVFRLGNAETIAWELASPGVDLTLTVSANDLLTFSGLDCSAGDQYLTANASGEIDCGTDDGGGSVEWSALIDPTGAMSMTSSTVTELMDWDYQANYTAELLFDVRTTTGTPSGGVLANFQVHDADVTVFRAWDGTDGVQVTGAGAFGIVGSGTIVATSGDSADSFFGSGTIEVARGGTNLASGTDGGILGYTATGTLASSALLVANALVMGGGAGATPSTPLGLGTTTTLLHGNAGGAPTWGAVVSADLNITATDCTNQFVQDISSAGAGACTTVTLASADFANQGTTTTVLHGNAAGNPSFGLVTASDTDFNTYTALIFLGGSDSTWAWNTTGGTNPVMSFTGSNINISTGGLQVGGTDVGLAGGCTNQFVTDVNAGAVPSCATVTSSDTDETTFTGVTWGANADFVWNFNTVGGSNPDSVISFTSANVNISTGVLQEGGVNVVVDTLALTGGNGIATLGDLSSDRTVAIDLLTADDQTGSSSNQSGLEFGDTGSDKLGLLRGCGDGQVEKFNTTGGLWECADDDDSGGATAWDAIGPAGGDGSIDFVATQQDIIGQLDAAAEVMLTLTNQDADAANSTTILSLQHNDGADAEVVYLSMIGDADGSPTNDYLFTQVDFTSLLPMAGPSWTGTGSDGVIEFPNSAAANAGADVGRLRYESATQRLRASFNTAGYSDIALASDNLSLFSATTSLEFIGVISDPTGTGLSVFNDTPTIITPDFTTGFTIGGAADSDDCLLGDATTFVAATTCVLDGDSPNAAGDISGDYSAGLTIDAGSVASAELATANKTLPTSISMIDPTTAEDDKVQWMYGTAVTFTDVDCSTDTGTVTIDMDHRVITTPNSTGTDILTGTIVCDTDNQADGGFADATIPANVPVNLSITATSGSPGTVRIFIRYTVD